ncbi:MAG: hypothetical protein GY856_20045 [bacterium]|nr:hypothetical protein [bacterium]
MRKHLVVKEQCRRPGSGRYWLLLVLAALLLPEVSMVAANPSDDGGIELTSPVRQNLRRLQESWQHWTRAYYRDDRDQAEIALEELLLLADYLGMSRLPDLSIATAAYAVRSARDGNFERAHWALEASQQLDPERSETEFASGTVRRLEGDYVGAVSGVVKGYLSLFRFPVERSIWLQNIGLWLIYLLLLSGGLYLALQIGIKGPGLFYDLGRLVSPPLPRAAADLVAILLLVWPLVLPSGVLWLALYWSILLWGYCSVSERTVLIGLWLILGLMPAAVVYQQRRVQTTLIPPTRAMENVATGRLYGEIFSDLNVLLRLLPDHPVVTESVADLHRRFGQWEHARLIYKDLLEQSDRDRSAAPAINNIGVYHHRNADYGTAVNYFTDAADVDDYSPEAFFNLSQAYSQLYDFTASHEALARAKELNAPLVATWEASGTSEARAIPIDGGLRRVAEIHETLRSPPRSDDESPQSGPALGRRYLSPLVGLAAVVLAVTLHLVRRTGGYPSQKFAGPGDTSGGGRWLRALLPGWASTLEGHGGRAFMAILLPMAVITVLLIRSLGYRVPLGYDAGTQAATILCMVILLIIALVRLGVVFKAEG